MHLSRFGRFVVIGVLGVMVGTATLGAQESKPSKPAVPNYTRTSWFPKFIEPFNAPMVPEPRMSNSERVHLLIGDGKLRLSVEDALVLALENNLDIAVARYGPAYAQTDIVRSLSGGSPRGVQGAFTSAALFAGAIGGGIGGAAGAGGGGAGGVLGGGGASNTGSVGTFDPVVGASFGWDHSNTPLGIAVLQGVPVSLTQTSNVSTFFAKRFMTGTSFVMALSGRRQSTNSITSLFDPQVTSGLTLGLNQPLLNGFGYRANARFIRISRTSMDISTSVFRQQLMTTITQILNYYWDLVAFRDSVRVAESALGLSQKLLSDNKRQVEIGTLAPIEVVRADAEVASNQRALIVAQTNLQQQQELLKTALSKQVDAELAAVSLEPTGVLPEPKPDDIPPLEEALKQAAQNRPEIEQAELNLRNQDVVIKANRNALLPSLDAFATYISQGLSGDRITRVTGTPSVLAVQQGGLSQALSQVFHRNFPDYSFGLSLQIPLRNRTAQADAARALLEERQLQTQMQQTKNNIGQQVRTAEIALIQAKAQIEAASKSVLLQQQTLDAERKKFQLGESSVFLVIQAQRDLVTAEGTEVQAKSNYAKALIQLAQATGTTLAKNHIELNGALEGKVEHSPNIPGTPPAPASAPGPGTAPGW